MKKLFFITVLTFLTNLAMASPDLEEATNDVCKCLEEPHNKAREAIDIIKNAHTSGDMSQLIAAQGNMKGVISVSTRCFEGLQKKYPEINKSDELKNRVMDMAEKQCPNPASELLRKQ